MKRGAVLVFAGLLIGCQSGSVSIEGEWKYGPISVAKGQGVSSATVTFTGGQAKFGVEGDAAGMSGLYRMDADSVVITVEGKEMIFTP